MGCIWFATASVLLQFSGTTSRRSIAMVALDEPKTPFSPVKRTSPKKAAKSVQTPVAQEMPTITPTPETREMCMKGIHMPFHTKCTCLVGPVLTPPTPTHTVYEMQPVIL